MSSSELPSDYVTSRHSACILLSLSSTATIENVFTLIFCSPRSCMVFTNIHTFWCNMLMMSLFFVHFLSIHTSSNLKGFKLQSTGVLVVDYIDAHDWLTGTKPSVRFPNLCQSPRNARANRAKCNRKTSSSHLPPPRDPTGVHPGAVPLILFSLAYASRVQTVFCAAIIRLFLPNFAAIR